ncbi:protein-disulfide reductase DsbD [Thalassotalea litorea]|uniref:Thiol:disulfide interchange protein DsbD n=1 Tax=Thalassotalea litorea TaxID=2020715 RepID=A0A5R9IUQ2_9GAMM|nr:protein-disulfide reductase DsbD [Thalassotalea litorea]TLU67081.1 protein-disulfide reductase DsbD [Thalassotalea litorea]
MRALLRLLILTLCVTGTSTQAQNSPFDTSMDSLFSNQDEFLQVDQAFQFDFNQQGNSVEVYFNIAEGYYLYKEKLVFKSDSAEFQQPTLPQGREHEDEFFGVQQVYYQKLKFDIPIESATDNSSIELTYQGCAEKGLCYPPTKKVIFLSAVGSGNGVNDNADNEQGNSSAILGAIIGNNVDSINNSSKNVLPDSTEQAAANGSDSEQFELASLLTSKNFALILLTFFGLGILLSFTPCVFPMYPILTGIIVGQGDKLSTGKAFSLSMAYVQGMAITYTILGVVVALAGAQFQAAFQHPAILIGLSILFVVLALSMFGVFNLSMPSSWQQKLNQLSSSQRGGSLVSVFVMGAISGLVASPCTTAPLTGILIYIAQSGDIVLGATALYVLSMGMGLPLLVLGSSGGKLLPKAGNWMNVIKSVFGLLLLAVPIFLLERLLPATVANLLWAALLLGSATYFYVVNNDNRKSPATFGYGIRSLIIFLMLFSGGQLAYQTLFDAPLKQAAASHKEFIKVASLDELDREIAKANAGGLTVMLDLYADWCAACKEFEQKTFPKPSVQQALHNTVMLQADLTDLGNPDSLAFMEEYDVFGLPSILFFDKTGRELDKNRVTGFMNADKFSTHINEIFN